MHCKVIVLEALLAESGGKATITITFDLDHSRSSTGMLGFTLTLNRVDFVTGKAEDGSTSLSAEPAESKTALRTLRDKTPNNKGIQVAT